MSDPLESERSAAGAPPWAPGFGHLTASEPPIPCGFRERPEDFEVEELPAYAPSGEGEHLYLWVEKRGLTTDEALRRLGRALGRPRQAFGVAGRKDRHAVTRQWVSVAGVDAREVARLALDDLAVLRAERHPHKLRVGKLRGNRFRVRLRGVAAEDRARLERVLARLAAHGLPNWYGAQRFGTGGRSFELGRLLVQRRLGEYVLALASPEQAGDAPAVAELRAAIERGARGALRGLQRELSPDLARLARQLARRPADWGSALRALDRSLPRLHVSALQARVFNRVLAARLPSGALGIDRLVAGDLAFLHASGAVFRVEDPAAEAPRALAFELSPSGPLPGWRGSEPEGEPLELERAALASEGVARQDFRGLGSGLDAKGARRPLRVPLDELSCTWEERDAVLGFSLPSGSYATALVEELRKDWRARS